MQPGVCCSNIILSFPSEESAIWTRRLFQFCPVKPFALAEPSHTIGHSFLRSENKGLSFLFSTRTLDRFFSWSLGTAARHVRLPCTQYGNRHTC
jgi:hypothetical protein